MRLRDEWHLPASPAVVRARAVDRGARTAAGAEVREVGGGVVVTSTERVPTGARGVAAALVGTELALRRTECWSTPTPGGVVLVRVDVTVDDRPLDARVDLRLEPHGVGSRCRVAGTARARMPGVGGVVEKRFAAELLQGLRDGLRQVPAGAAA